MLDRLKAFYALDGRITRLTYWKTSLHLAIAVFLIIIALIGLSTAGVNHWILTAIAAVLGAAILVKIFAIGLRRAHDRNRRLLIYAAYLAVPTIVEATGHMANLPALVVVANLMDMAVLVDIGLMPGTRGPNAYGADPRGM